MSFSRLASLTALILVSAVIRPCGILHAQAEEASEQVTLQILEGRGRSLSGVGEVFGSEESTLSFRHLKYSLGGGLRFLFDKDQGINLRMDLGFGRGSSGLYFGLEEAF